MAVLNNSGNLIGSQLYGPYGNSRYSSGTLPTSIGFTGQRSDSATGLDYYNARYYDPVVGQFLSADLKQGNAQGMSPYAYVGGNPETRTDPTGQRFTDGNGDTAIISNGNVYIDLPSKNETQILQLPGKKPSKGGLQCGQGTVQVGNQCVSSIQCGSGTILKGNSCVADPREQTRKDKLSSLQLRGQLEIFAGALIFFAGDIFAFLNAGESALARLNALIDALATLINTLLPDVASLFGGTVAEYVDQFCHFAAAVMAGIEVVMAGLTSSFWWISGPANIVASGLIDTMGGPAEIFMQGIMVLTKPAIGYLIDAGGHALQSAGFADEAEYQRQMDMPIQDWCAQYDGGCTSSG